MSQQPSGTEYIGVCRDEIVVHPDFPYGLDDALRAELTIAAEEYADVMKWNEQYLGRLLEVSNTVMQSVVNFVRNSGDNLQQYSRRGKHVHSATNSKNAFAYNQNL